MGRRGASGTWGGYFKRWGIKINRWWQSCWGGGCDFCGGARGLVVTDWDWNVGDISKGQMW